MACFASLTHDNIFSKIMACFAFLTQLLSDCNSAMSSTTVLWIMHYALSPYTSSVVIVCNPSLASIRSFCEDRNQRCCQKIRNLLGDDKPLKFRLQTLDDGFLFPLFGHLCHSLFHPCLLAHLSIICVLLRRWQLWCVNIGSLNLRRRGFHGFQRRLITLVIWVVWPVTGSKPIPSGFLEIICCLQLSLRTNRDTLLLESLINPLGLRTPMKLEFTSSSP